MKTDFEKQISSLDLLMRDGGSYIINNSGRIVALITAVIATLVTFANVSFSAFTSESFSIGLAIMLFSSYVIYFSLEASGERLGEKSEEYSDASEKYNATRARISADDVLLLREFCFNYAKEDARYRKRDILTEAGLTEEDYKSYKKGTAFSRKEISAFRRCDRIKPKKLTPPLLLCRDRSVSRCELKGPSGAKAISMLLGLLPTTVGTFFTVSVILTVKSELSASTVIEGIIKLLALPMIGFKGYSSGYSFVKNSKCRWIETKTEILEEFLIEREKLKTKELQKSA